MAIFVIGAFLGFLIGRAVYRPAKKRNKLNNAILARDIFPKRKS